MENVWEGKYAVIECKMKGRQKINEAKILLTDDCETCEKGFNSTKIGQLSATLPEIADI